MRIDQFDYDLPPELIAQQPIEPRDASRLLVMDRRTGGLGHRMFFELPLYLKAGDVLVLNDTRVMPARLIGRRQDSGGRVELLLLKETADACWEVLVRPGKRCQPGSKIEFSHSDLVAEVMTMTPAGGRLVTFNLHGPALWSAFEQIGQVPLPPYIHNTLANPERYQTVYAKGLGSAAAPTAGLHFTAQLLATCRCLGVEIVFITLDVGLGTFRPVRTEIVEQHKMHEEKYFISEKSADVINAGLSCGRRIIAVGTTVVRALETARHEKRVQSGPGSTQLFVLPGFSFQIVDALVTNFHLPQSTLLMLISAFAGQDKVQAAYAEAIKMRYRFFSFGDAMLII